MRISDWSSDVCSSDLLAALFADAPHLLENAARLAMRCSLDAAPSSQKPMLPRFPDANGDEEGMLREMAVAGFEKRIAKIPDQKKGEYRARLATKLDILCAQGFSSEEHTSELQSLMRIT